MIHLDENQNIVEYTTYKRPLLMQPPKMTKNLTEPNSRTAENMIENGSV